MKSIDELIADKLIDITQHVLSKLIKPDITLDNVGSLDVAAVERLKAEQGIEAIILDVDDTIRKEGFRGIPKHNREWIESLRGRIKIIILSNGVDNEIEEYFRNQGIDYIGFAMKPLKKNFKKACKKMNVSPDKVLVVGDSVLDDVYGGRRNKMKTALVKKVEDEGR